MLNPALFKLKISQAKCPVYTGQVLPLLKDKLRLNEQDSLNYGFYKVDSVSRQKSYGKHKAENYHLALTPVEWDAVSLDWFPAKDPSSKEASVSPHPFDISISSQELHDTFGVLTEKTSHAAAEDAISKIIMALFKKAGKLREFHDKYANIDFDKIFRIVALKAMELSPKKMSSEDKEDVFHNALVKFLDSDAIQKFDAEKGNFVNFIWGVFHNVMRQEVKNYLRVNRYERLLKNIDIDEGSTLEEQMDALTTDKKDLSENVVAKEIIEDFKDYLEATSRSSRLREIVDLLVDKASRNEIAEKFGVQKTRVFQYCQDILKFLKQYAEDSENEDLLAAIKDAAHKKSSTKKVANWFVDILTLYVERAEPELEEDTEEKVEELLDEEPELEESEEEEGEHTAAAEDDSLRLAERVPVGETIRIKRRPLPDFTELTKKVVQDPEKSSSQAKTDVESYLEEITSADELIEHDGKLIAIRIERK